MNVRRREMLSAAHWLMQVFVLPLLCGFVAACLRIAARGRGYCFAFCRLVAAFAARPCDAGAGCSDLVAASGGQGGIGGLRVPPTPSLDSRVPLCTAAAPLRGWRRRSDAFLRGALPLGQGFGCCFALFAVRRRGGYGCGALPFSSAVGGVAYEMRLFLRGSARGH